MKNNKGFTLVEILVVVAIIAILAGVAFTGLSGVQSTARDTARIANLEAIRTYLEAYNTQCGHYPGIADADASRPNCSSATAHDNWAALTLLMNAAGITGKLPNDPIPGRNYRYGVDAANGGLKYVIGATLEKDNNKLRGAVTGAKFTIPCDNSAAVRLYCVTSE